MNDLLLTMYDFLTTNSKYITIFIIVFLTIIITVSVYKYHKNKEGLANPFEAIFKIFQMIGEIFTDIFELFANVGDIFAMIMCPISVFTHIDTCAYYWSLDKLFYFIWLIVWLFCFIFIYIPLWLASIILCICIGKWMGGCWTISVNDVCPTKKGFFNGVENFYEILFGGRLLYRNRSDINTCYCVPALKYLFDPLTKYKSLAPNSDSGGRGGGSASFIVPCIILGIVVVANYKKKTQ